MNTAQVLNLLSEYESRNVTHIEGDGSWPMVWQKAKGVQVWDPEGRRYLDLTAAFGVAASGHAHPRIVRVAQNQMKTLLHAMGDVHPHALKAELARELSRVTFGRWQRRPRGQGKTLFCNSGFEAVEAALKTARLATGKREVLAFRGAYHGLGYGALNATHRRYFRSPFQNQLGNFGRFLPFPTTNDDLPELAERLEKRLLKKKVGVVLVEPVQGRGGTHVPPPGFLPLLRRLCDEHEVLLAFDEIYTGFGRTGKWFACEHWKTVPDLICLGKALTGGFPLSACVGRAEIMDTAWPESTGEAIHTSTFLGHPVGCAMALEQLKILRKERLVQRSARLGGHLMRALKPLGEMLPGASGTVRGLGLMVGFEWHWASGSPASGLVLNAVKQMLARGFILLPEGEHGNIFSFTPPLTITEAQLSRTVKELARKLNAGAAA